jgi:hypothetical protein
MRTVAHRGPPWWDKRRPRKSGSLLDFRLEGTGSNPRSPKKRVLRARDALRSLPGLPCAGEPLERATFGFPCGAENPVIAFINTHLSHSRSRAFRPQAPFIPVRIPADDGAGTQQRPSKLSCGSRVSISVRPKRGTPRLTRVVLPTPGPPVITSTLERRSQSVDRLGRRERREQPLVGYRRAPASSAARSSRSFSQRPSLSRSVRRPVVLRNAWPRAPGSRRRRSIACSRPIRGPAALGATKRSRQQFATAHLSLIGVNSEKQRVTKRVAVQASGAEPLST